MARGSIRRLARPPASPRAPRPGRPPVDDTHNSRGEWTVKPDPDTDREIIDWNASVGNDHNEERKYQVRTSENLDRPLWPGNDRRRIEMTRARGRTPQAIGNAIAKVVQAVAAVVVQALLALSLRAG